MSKFIRSPSTRTADGESIREIARALALLRTTCVRVHRYLNAGFDSSIYQSALAHRLRKEGLRVTTQPSVCVRDEDGTEIGSFSADLLIEDAILAEVTVARELSEAAVERMIRRVTASRYRHGALVGFGGVKLEFRRVFSRRTRGRNGANAARPLAERRRPPRTSESSD